MYSYEGNQFFELQKIDYEYILCTFKLLIQQKSINSLDFRNSGRLCKSRNQMSGLKKKSINMTTLGALKMTTNEFGELDSLMRFHEPKSN